MSLKYRALVVGPLETNCYIVWDVDSLKAAIIDPGGNLERIVSVIQDEKLNVERMLLTHGHPDHTFYAGSLANSFNVAVGMHKGDELLLTESLSIAEMFYDVSQYVDFSPAEPLQDGDVIFLGDSRIEVLHTPGHSQGGLCFKTDLGVFCGDTIFAGSIGRTDFPGGSYEQLINSIKEKILILDPSTPLYPGHGPSTTVGIERQTNPFLQ